MFKRSTECSWFWKFIMIYKYWIITFSPRMTLDNITNVIYCWTLFIKDNQFVLLFIEYFLFILKMDLFSWIFSLKIFLSLRDVTTWILFNLPVICWLDMNSMTCCTVAGYYFPMIRIYTLVQFLSDNAWLHGILFFDKYT